MKRLLLVGIGVALVVGVSGFGEPKSTPQATVQGVWRVAEVTTTGPSGSANAKPQPGLYIFTAKHYAMVRVNADKPRPNLPTDLTKATASELLAVWDPFTANAGTYEVSGGSLTTRPLVAKNPTVMSQGAFNAYSFKLDGSTLTLTGLRNQSGPIPNPTTLKLTRIE